MILARYIGPSGMHVGRDLYKIRVVSNTDEYQFFDKTQQRWSYLTFDKNWWKIMDYPLVAVLYNDN